MKGSDRSRSEKVKMGCVSARHLPWWIHLGALQPHLEGCQVPAEVLLGDKHCVGCLLTALDADQNCCSRRRRQSLLLSPVKYVELWHSVCEMLILCSMCILSWKLFSNMELRDHWSFHALNMTNKQDYNLSKFWLSVKFQ